MLAVVMKNQKLIADWNTLYIIIRMSPVVMVFSASSFSSCLKVYIYSNLKQIFRFYDSYQAYIWILYISCSRVIPGILDQQTPASEVHKQKGGRWVEVVFKKARSSLKPLLFHAHVFTFKIWLDLYIFFPEQWQLMILNKTIECNSD